MRLLFLALTLLGFAAASAQPAASAPAYILVAMDSGTVIEDHDANVLWYPASLTKLMTAYVTFRALAAGRLRLTSPVVVSANARSEPPSKMGYKTGTVLTVENALKIMIVKSANDIAVAVAETVGGSESQFVAMMNAEARRLGMNSTRYQNPNGLPSPGQVTTARDQAVLARAIYTEFPGYRPLFQIPAIRVGNEVMRSQNTLLERVRGTDGMKTGFICASGFNLVATASRHGRSLIAVVLGALSSEQRAEAAARLLEVGFRGGRIGLLRPKLASFGRSPAGGRVSDMRPYVCGKRKLERLSPILAEGGDSALGPRFVLMEPVRVGVGGAELAPSGGRAVAEAAPGAAIPLPRLRPAYR